MAFLHHPTVPCTVLYRSLAEGRPPVEPPIGCGCASPDATGATGDRRREASMRNHVDGSDTERYVRSPDDVVLRLAGRRQFVTLMCETGTFRKDKIKYNVYSSCQGNAKERR